MVSVVAAVGVAHLVGVAGHCGLRNQSSEFERSGLWEGDCSWEKTTCFPCSEEVALLIVEAVALKEALSSRRRSEAKRATAKRGALLRLLAHQRTFYS